MSTTRPDLTEYVSLPQAALDGWANAQVSKERSGSPWWTATMSIGCIGKASDGFRIWGATLIWGVVGDVEEDVANQNFTDNLSFQQPTDTSTRGPP